MSLLDSKRLRHVCTRGFTLLELLVTISIIAIISAVVIVQYNDFNSSVLLKSQAYELALNMREAQVFSISVRGEGGAFRNAYGVYFDMSTPSQYLLFLDDEGTEPAMYDQSPTNEQIGNPFVIDSRFMIVQICVNDCSTAVSSLSVSFQRPDFDAQIAAPGVGAINSARIDIAPVSDQDIVRSVIISATGQISVE